MIFAGIIFLKEALASNNELPKPICWANHDYTGVADILIKYDVDVDTGAMMTIDKIADHFKNALYLSGCINEVDSWLIEIYASLEQYRVFCTFIS